MVMPYYERQTKFEEKCRNLDLTQSYFLTGRDCSKHISGIAQVVRDGEVSFFIVRKNPNKHKEDRVLCGITPYDVQKDCKLIAIPATKIRDMLSPVFSYAEQGDHTVITRFDEPIATIVSVEEYDLRTNGISLKLV